MAMQSVLGLMSGTSLDGVDVAMLPTDGETIGEFGPTFFRPYDESERGALKAALAEARSLSDRTARPAAVAAAERIVTDAHIDAIAQWRRQNTAHDVDLIGFHGQTVLHAPQQYLTIQIGDAGALARTTGVPVVHDFRAADVEAGGEGAPFVPVYHRALIARAGLAGPVCVINIGGVANITRVAPDGSMLAGDTGPGNALLDDFVLARTGRPFDSDGELAARGRVDEQALAALMADPWFDEPFPKSLDRDSFSAGPVAVLSDEDGAATLTAFTAFAIAAALVAAGGVQRVVVVGGGANNPTMLGQLADAIDVPLHKGADFGWSGDFIEAQAFAYLAARSLAALPLSYPETTGVSQPMTGGIVVRP